MTSTDQRLSQVVLANARRERVLQKHACRSSRASRRNPAAMAVPDRENVRPAFAHDADRILHSRAYTRYIDKTQVFYQFQNDHITHRVLHVQLVSKIARTIGRCLRLNEDLIEAIALGHDLGHVPFGHDGERALAAVCRLEGLPGFAHNVQSVRAVERLEGGGSGLNLTLQVLDGILSHNGEMVDPEYLPDYAKDWEQFDREYAACAKDPEASKQVRPMTLEGCVVRVSDVIAYLGRDITDALLLGVVSSAALPWDILGRFGVRSETDINRSIVDAMAMDLIGNSQDKDRLVFSRHVFDAVNDLKQWNYNSIYFSPAMNKATQQDRLNKTFGHLYQNVHGAICASDHTAAVYHDFLSGMSDDYRSGTDPKRQAVDYIAGMTDDYLREQFTAAFLPAKLGHRLPTMPEPSDT
jgi:dGTPase